MQNKIILFLFLSSLILCIVGLYVFVNPSSIMKSKATSRSTVSDTATRDTVEQEVSVTKKPENALYTGKQSPGRSISMDMVILKKGGFVVVYENTPEPTGEILGASTYLSAGEYEGVKIELSREVKNGEIFNAMVHADNGDKAFDISKDPPLRDDSGNGYFTDVIIQSVAR